MKKKCMLLVVCGTTEPDGPLQVLNLTVDLARDYTRIPHRIVWSQRRFTDYIAELNLNTAESVGHVVGGKRCINRHAIFAVSGYTWLGLGNKCDLWRSQHPSVDDAYDLRERFLAIQRFESDGAQPRLFQLQQQYNEAMRAYLIACSDLQDAFAAGYLADADNAMQVAANRTREFLKLAEELRQKQLPG